MTALYGSRLKPHTPNPNRLATEYPTVRFDDPETRRQCFAHAFALVLRDAPADTPALTALRNAGFPDTDILEHWRIT